MRVQAFLRAAAINLKRLAATLLGSLIVPICAMVDAWLVITIERLTCASLKGPAPQHGRSAA
jgi:hypothetical protein